jgi:hypothetical protein
MFGITQDITNSLMKSHDPMGILLYGSAVKDSTSAADVDLICITRTNGHRHFMMTIQQATVDVYADTRDSLEKSIRSDKRDNNNLILNAFVSGRRLMALDNSMDTLISIANEVWSAGPQKPSADEFRAISLALNKGLHAAESYAARASQSPERQGLASINIGQIFLRATYAYCRIHQLWSSTVSEMLEWEDDHRYQELITLCSIFLRAPSLEQQVAVLTEMTHRTIGDAIRC